MPLALRLSEGLGVTLAELHSEVLFVEQNYPTYNFWLRMECVPHSSRGLAAVDDRRILRSGYDEAHRKLLLKSFAQMGNQKVFTWGIYIPSTQVVLVPQDSTL